MESVVEREDPSVDVVTLETPNLNSMLASNSATLPCKMPCCHFINITCCYRISYILTQRLFFFFCFWYSSHKYLLGKKRKTELKHNIFRCSPGVVTTCKIFGHGISTL